MTRWILFVLFFGISLTVPALADRAILLIWDSHDTRISETYSPVVTELMRMRSAGLFAKVKGLQKGFKVYDVHDKRQAQAVQALDLARRDQLPYLSVVEVENKAVKKKIWGQQMKGLQATISDLEGFLGLATTAVTANQIPRLTQTKLVLPDNGWAQWNKSWLHSSGLTLLPGEWKSIEVDGDRLVMEDVSGNHIFILATEGTNVRLDLFNKGLSVLKDQDPTLVFKDPVERKQGELDVIEQHNVPRPGERSVIVGSIGSGSKAMVYVAFILADSDLLMAEDDVEKMLNTVKIARP